MSDSVTTIESDKDTRVKRRGLIAGAAALVATLATRQAVQPVAAHDAQDVLLGGPNSTANATSITNTATNSANALVLHSDASANGTGLVATGSSYGVQGTGATFAGLFGDTSNSSGAGVVGIARSSSGGIGVSGNCEAPDGFGVNGSSRSGTGVLGVVGQKPNDFGPQPVGIFGLATTATGLGGVFQGVRAPLRLVPVAQGTGNPTTGTHQVGELFVDSAGALFYCTADGTPGTWVNLSSPATTPPPPPTGVTSIAATGGSATGAVSLVAGPNVTITEAANAITIASTASTGGGPSGPVLTILPTPERFVDTRSKLGGLQGPAAANTTHTFTMTGRNGQSGNAALQIPDAATAIVGNLTVVGAAGIPLGSFLTVWPGGTQPTVSNINFGPATVTGAVANSFVSGLTSVSGHGSLTIFNLSACDYILDVTGYYK